MANQSGSRHDNAGSLLPAKREPKLSPTATPAALALHNNFKTSVVALKRDLVRSIHYLTVISDKNIHRMLGYKSIYEYGEGVAGFTEGQTRAFLKIGRRLQELPELKRAMANGLLSWTKAEKIAQNATPDNEMELIGLAQSMSVRELGLHVGKPKENPATALILPPPKLDPIPKPAIRKPRRNPPSDIVPKPASEKCHVTFVFTPEEYSRWEAMIGRGGGRSKEVLLLEGMACLNEESVGNGLTGPEHLIIIHECPVCGNAALNNSRGTFKVEKPLLEGARCDATIQSEDGRRRSVIPPRLRRQVLARDHNRCQYPGCLHTRFLQIHHRVPVSQGGRTELENLVTLCSRCHLRLHADEADLKLKGRDPVQ